MALFQTRKQSYLAFLLMFILAMFSTLSAFIDKLRGGTITEGLALTALSLACASLFYTDYRLHTKERV